MKRFSIVYLVIALLFVFSCSDKNEKEKVSKPGTIDYSIKATVSNTNGDVVYLEEIRDKKWIVIDSTTIKDGAFELDGNVEAIDIYRLRFAENAFIPLLLNADKIAFSTIKSVAFKSPEELESIVAFLAFPKILISPEDEA